MSKLTLSIQQDIIDDAKKICQVQGEESVWYSRDVFKNTNSRRQT